VDREVPEVDITMMLAGDAAMMPLMEGGEAMDIDTGTVGVTGIIGAEDTTMEPRHIPITTLRLMISTMDSLPIPDMIMCILLIPSRKGLLIKSCLKIIQMMLRSILPER
jgi:hypothetical protein